MRKWQKYFGVYGIDMIRILIITDNMEEWAQKISQSPRVMYKDDDYIYIEDGIVRYQIISNPQFAIKTFRCDKVVIDKPVNITTYEELIKPMANMPRAYFTSARFLSKIVGC